MKKIDEEEAKSTIRSEAIGTDQKGSDTMWNLELGEKRNHKDENKLNNERISNTENRSHKMNYNQNDTVALLI